MNTYDYINRIVITLPLNGLRGYVDNTLPSRRYAITMILRVRRNFFEITTFPNTEHLPDPDLGRGAHRRRPSWHAPTEPSTSSRPRRHTRTPPPCRPGCIRALSLSHASPLRGRGRGPATTDAGRALPGGLLRRRRGRGGGRGGLDEMMVYFSPH